MRVGPRAGLVHLGSPAVRSLSPSRTPELLLSLPLPSEDTAKKRVLSGNQTGGTLILHFSASRTDGLIGIRVARAKTTFQFLLILSVR